MSKLRTITYTFTALVAAILLIVSSVLLYNILTSNIHTVIPDVVYRSAQLNESQLIKLINKYKIKSIINLRGKQIRKSWYDLETSIARNMKIEYYNIAINAHGIPNKISLIKLINNIVRAKKPILIHCKEGADRTGLASAIAIILLGKEESIKNILNQMSWRYNVYATNTIGYEVFSNYMAWAKRKKLKINKNSLTEWISSKDEIKTRYGIFT